MKAGSSMSISGNKILPISGTRNGITESYTGDGKKVYAEIRETRKPSGIERRLQAYDAYTTEQIPIENLERIKNRRGQTVGIKFRTNYITEKPQIKMTFYEYVKKILKDAGIKFSLMKNLPRL